MPSPAPGLLDDLAVFLAVVDGGSVAAGARSLGIDASTVSRRVARLEEGLGAALFQRTGRGMALSEPGRRLADRVRAAVHQVSLGLDELTQVPDVLSGEVRVTAPTEVGTAFVVPILGAFAEAHPDVQVHLELGTHLVELDRREADVALRTVRPQRGDVITRRLPGRRAGAYRSPTLPDAEARRRWLAYSADDPAVDRFVAAIPGARIVLRTNDLAGLRAACVAGIGAALLPTDIAAPLGLVLLDGTELVTGPPLWLAAPSTSLELPRVRAVWDALADGWEALPDP